MCSVFFCRNTPTDKDISFHAFPHDEPRRTKWIRYCDHPLEFKPKVHSKVCSKHFTKDQFTRDPQFTQQYMEAGARQHLKRDSVPDIPISALNCNSDDTIIVLDQKIEAQLKLLPPIQKKVQVTDLPGTVQDILSTRSALGPSTAAVFIPISMASSNATIADSAESMLVGSSANVVKAATLPKSTEKTPTPSTQPSSKATKPDEDDDDDVMIVDNPSPVSEETPTRRSTRSKRKVTYSTEAIEIEDDDIIPEPVQVRKNIDKK